VRPPIAALTSAERKRLVADIYYLNTSELRFFCDAHRIPYFIYAETTAGRIARTRDTDRKGVVIDRILHFLNTGEVKPETVFRRGVVASPLAGRRPQESDPVLYRRYRNHDEATLDLMKSLTGGKFEFGAIAQEVLRDCWSRGKAPTYREFAQLWQKAVSGHSEPNPEWAYLSDLARGEANADWKRIRDQKAAFIMVLLEKACPSQGRGRP
jgi:hypothetical protein